MIPASDTAVRKLVALAIDVTDRASTGQIFLSPFERSSIAGVEEIDMLAAGITDNDVTSMLEIRQMLDSYDRSAIAHIRAAAVLMGSDRSAPPLLSIAALSRISCEASSIAFWLSDPELNWDARLQRCNHLQFRMLEDGLVPSKKFAKVLSTPFIEAKLAEYREGMNDVIDFAKRRDWKHEDQSPSNSNWSKGIPRFTQFMRDLVESKGEPATVGQMLYSLGSGVVHSNPILVGLASHQVTPVAGQYSAALKIKNAMWCYRLLMDRTAKWTDWETGGDWFDEVQRICQVLQSLYEHEIQCLPDPTEELKEYQRHLSEVHQSRRDRNDQGSPWSLA